MYAFGFTDTGQVRQQNQDAFFVSDKPMGPLPNLFIVADGMGGHKAGDVASREAVERFCKYFADLPKAETPPEDYITVLRVAAIEINQQLYDMAQADPDALKGMGTTFIACVIENGRADFVHVGDSRVYSLTPGAITQITHDHTYAEEMYRAGEITDEEARVHPKRHHLTRVMGFDARVTFDGFSYDLKETSSLLMCSDGLSNMLDDFMIMEIINREGYAEHRAHMLVEEANHRGGTDNITAVLIDLRGGDSH